MCQDNLLPAIFSSSIAFSAFLIVVVTFLLSIYEKRRFSLEEAKSVEMAIKLATLSFLFGMSSSLLSGMTLVLPLLLCTEQIQVHLLELEIFSVLSVVLLLVSLLIATFTVVQIVRNIMLIKFL